MNSEASRQATDSSLSKVTVHSARSEAVVALGKRLVVELGLDDSVDTLGRWMAHYVAQLIQEVEATTGDAQLAKQAQLRDEIMALWAHRYELPHGKRPFGEFEPILRAIATLDPENRSPRYFSPRRGPDNQTDESKETLEWIELAHALDYASKVLIDYCLTMAADAALDKSKEWVELAKKASIDDTFDLRVIRFVKDQSDLMKEPDPNAYQRRLLTDRQKKLDAFLSLASKLANDLSTRLKSLPPAVDDSGDATMSEGEE